MTEHKFDKQCVASLMKFSEKILTNLEFKSFEHHEDCFVRNQLAMRLEAEFYKKTRAEREITYYFDKPTFFDWLFGRKKSKTIKINIEDVLLNPPLIDDTVRIYNLEKLD